MYKVHLLLLIIYLSINYCYCQYSNGWDDTPLTSEQLDLEPKDLKVSNAAESVIFGKKKDNSTFGGVVHLYQFEDERIEMFGMICGLKPNSTHGLSIHKFGELHPNCSSTMGHFNPYNEKHGSHRNDKIDERHLGDLGNVRADNLGVARFKIKDYNLRIDDNDIFSILGRSVVLHSKPDDLGNDKVFSKGSKYNGNSGKPVACGVIGIADTETLFRKPLQCVFNNN